MKRLLTASALLLALLLSLFSFSACSKENKKPVGSCFGQEILFEELRFQALMYREKNPNASEAQIRTGVEAELCRQYAILSLCAEKLPQVTVESETIREAVDLAIDSAIASQGGKSAYKQMLKDRYLTKDLLRRLLGIAQMQVELEKVLYTGTELESSSAFSAWLQAGNAVRAQYLFFPNEMPNAQAAADTARQQLKSGVALDKILSAEQKAAGAECRQPEFFFRDLNRTALESAALSLASAEAVSEVIATESGYCVLVRAEDDYETLQNYQQEAAFNRYRKAFLEQAITQAADKLTVEWNAYGNELVFSEIK